MYQAAAWTIASTIKTPGITGKPGKWSARYSSLSDKFLTAEIDFPGSIDVILSIRVKRIRVAWERCKNAVFFRLVSIFVKLIPYKPIQRVKDSLLPGSGASPPNA